MKKLSVIVVALGLVVACGGQTDEAPPAETVSEAPIADIASAARDQVSVELENEWVRALRIKLEPGAQLPRHFGGDRVVYSLSDYTIEWVEGDEAPTEKSWIEGEAHWHANGPHAVRNTGSSAAEFLVVERLDAELPAEAQTEGDPSEESSQPEHGRMLLENEAVRVAEVTLEPGESTGLHRGGVRVVYALSDYVIRWTEGDADPVEVSWSEGQAHWHQPAEHAVENTGDLPARYLVVTFLNLS